MINTTFGIFTIIAIVALIITATTTTTVGFLTLEFATAAEQKFTAKLFGDMEVPRVETNATGLAEFKPIQDENIVTYSLNVTDIDNVTAAHIHMGKQGQNGPIVVTLFKPDIPTGKMVTGLLSEGNISTANLEGPLDGKKLSDLTSSMLAVETYVNIHTTEHKDGQTRGQISNTTSGMMMK
jgi:CHRD domain